MEISLKNFRCWKDKTIQLAPEGITLLSGPSGIGKSSILEAILFAITGKGRNIITQGKSSCTVKVIFNDGVVVIRKKRPNTLQVKIPGGKIYDDDAAQGYIDEKFTNNFETLGYLGQIGKNTSFVLKGPSDKLAFIEQLAFYNVDIVELKNKAYELFKMDDEEYKTATTRVEILYQQVEECKDIKLVKFPIKTRDKKQAREKIKNNLDKSKLDYQKISKKIETYNTLQKQYEIVSGKIDILKPHINELIDRELNLKNSMEKIPTTVEKDLGKTVAKLKILKRQREIKELEKLINTNSKDLLRLQKLEIEEYKTMLESIKLWSKLSKREVLSRIKSLKLEIESIKESIKINRKLQKLEYDSTLIDILFENIEQAKRELDRSKEEYRIVKLSEEILTCPECQSNLKLEDNVLIKATHECNTHNTKEDCQKQIRIYSKQTRQLESSLQDAKTKQNKYETLSSELTTLPKLNKNSLKRTEGELEELEEYLSNNKKLECKKKEIQEKLDKKIFSRTVNELDKKLKSDKSRYTKFTKNIDPVSQSEQTLIEIKDKLQKQVFDLEKLTKDYERCKNSINETSQKLSGLEQKLPKKTKKEIESILTLSETQLISINKKVEKYEQLLHMIEIFNVSESEHQRQMKLKTDLFDFQKLEKEFRKKSAGASILRNKIKEAESICLYTFVQSIQGEVQMYLDEFFTKDPLILQLSTQKETKTKKTSKPEINIILDYKGRECDHTSLSGGELQRLILAFTLAFTERFNLPFLLLDECTSNLDQALTSEVVSVIKKYQHNRPVLLVAHQVVLGMFDKVINI